MTPGLSFGVGVAHMRLDVLQNVPHYQPPVPCGSRMLQRIANPVGRSLHLSGQAGKERCGQVINEFKVIMSLKPARVLAGDKEPWIEFGDERTDFFKNRGRDTFEQAVVCPKSMPNIPYRLMAGCSRPHSTKNSTSLIVIKHGLEYKIVQQVIHDQGVDMTEVLGFERANPFLSTAGINVRKKFLAMAEDPLTSLEIWLENVEGATKPKSPETVNDLQGEAWTHFDDITARIHLVRQKNMGPDGTDLAVPGRVIAWFR